MRGIPASTLSKEFCTVKELEGLNKLSALWNIKVSACGSIVLTALQPGCQVAA